MAKSNQTKLWLENYNDSNAFASPDMIGDGFSNVGRNSSPAWGGQFQNGGDVDLDAMRGMMKSKIGMGNALGHPAIKRMSQAMPKTGMTPEGLGTHYMSSMGEYAVPLLQDTGKDQLEYFENPKPSSEDIRFNSPEEAEYFAEHYKEVAPMSTIYNGLQEYQMGGSIPGAVGFTYARTKGIPSEGKYAKKTMPSAQNGKEMQYYQNGLDFQPKTISKNGGWLDKAQTGYQTGDKVTYGTPEYEEAYNKGEVVTEDGQRSPIALDEVVIQNNYKRPRGFWEQSRDKFLKDNKDAGLFEAIGSVATYPLSVGQHALTYAIEDKVQDPSEAWGYNTKEGWLDSPGAFGRNLVDFSLNTGLDPANLIGAGILTKENALSKLGKIRTSISPNLRKGLRTNDLLPDIRNNINTETNNYSGWGTDQWNVNNELSTPLPEIQRPINGHAPGTPEWNRLNNIIVGERDPLAQIDRAILNETTGSSEWNRLQIQRQQLLGTRNAGEDSWAQAYKPTSKNIKNKSGLTKEEILKNKNFKNKDVISKMSEQEFQESVLKPTGEIAPYKSNTEIDDIIFNADIKKLTLKDSSPLSVEEYTNKFNANLDKLNKIIAKNNKSGVEYRVKELNSRGGLVFETPAGQKAANTTKRSIVDILNTDIREFGNIFRNQVDVPEGTRTWGVEINPGEWSGEVQDIANAEYFKSIPGINMSNTTQGVFSDGVTRRGSGAYDSINEYLKELNLGRVKPGFNSQTEYSKGLWENSVQKNKAFGYYNNPNTVYGSMKSVLPYAGYTGAGALTYKALQGQEETPEYKQGGIIKDDRGQWDHPGEITEIGSNQITMQGVPYPVLGISDTGDTQMMYPEKDYKFKGKKVTEFPMAKNGLRQEQKGLVNLDDLTNFTNYNKPTKGWLDNY